MPARQPQIPRYQLLVSWCHCAYYTRQALSAIGDSYAARAQHTLHGELTADTGAISIRFFDPAAPIGRSAVTAGTLPLLLRLD
jgi:hypothetical protein